MNKEIKMNKVVNALVAGVINDFITNPILNVLGKKFIFWGQTKDGKLYLCGSDEYDTSHEPYIDVEVIDYTGQLETDVYGTKRLYELTNGLYTP